MDQRGNPQRRIRFFCSLPAGTDAATRREGLVGRINNRKSSITFRSCSQTAGSDIVFLVDRNEHPYSGCVSALAPHPTDSNILYIGTVNGGVWRGDNTSSTNITWTPLTEDQLSLSIGALALDSIDASGLTLVAASGRRSSFGAGGKIIMVGADRQENRIGLSRIS
jgi:hypothetical protein